MGRNVLRKLREIDFESAVRFEISLSFLHSRHLDLFIKILFFWYYDKLGKNTEGIDVEHTAAGGTAIADLENSAKLAMHGQKSVNKIYAPASGSELLLLQAKKHFNNHEIEM